MTSQISFNFAILEDEYLENKTRYQETKSVLMVFKSERMNFFHDTVPLTQNIANN